MRLIFFVILMSVVFFSCQNKRGIATQKPLAKPTAEKPACNPSSHFPAEDSSGTFVGLVKRFVDTSAEESSSCLVLQDAKGDSTFLYFMYNEVKNMDKKKTVIGSCVNVNFRAMIDREDGTEVSRSFFITDIKYQ